MEKIIINRSDAIGDLILTLPMASWIKGHLPQTKVAFIVRKGNRSIIDLCPFVDEVYEIEQKAGFFRSFFSFKKIFNDFCPDIYVDVSGNKWGAPCSFFLGIKSRLGLKNKLLPSIFLNKGQRQSRSLALMHESEYNLSLLNEILPPFHSEKLQEVSQGLLNLSEDLVKEGRSLLKELIPSYRSSDHSIFIHPGMTGHSLNWSARNYARLSQSILEKDHQAKIIISYTPSDAAYIETVKNQLGSIEKELQDRIFYLNGADVGLFGFIKMLANASTFVGGSTGPTHLAGALGIDLMAIYSPIRTQSAYRWRPVNAGGSQQIITPDVVCGEDRFCAGQSCPYYECMGKIEVKDVLDQFALLKR